MNEESQKLFYNLCSPNAKVGLEIGALDRPLIDKKIISESGSIHYLDHLSTADLKKKYQSDSSVNLDAIVDVDLICKDGDLDKSLGTEKFDYVVASHVIEHVPNVIKWLQSIFKSLKPNGILFLVIPDKRFTFDYLRPLTTFGSLLNAYHEKRTIPSIADVYDHYSTAMKIDGGKVWQGLFNNADLLPLASSDLAMKTAEDVLKNKNYHDVHVSVFTPHSFAAILEHLIENEFIFPQIVLYQVTKPYKIEFHVALRKPEESLDNLKQKSKATLPVLSIDSFLSPYMPQVKQLSEAVESLGNTNQELGRVIASQQSSFCELTENYKLLQKRMDISQATLDRKSIKLLLKAMHIIVGFKSLVNGSETREKK